MPGELNFRGYPVTVMSDGVAALLGDEPVIGLQRMLAQARDTAEPGEPSGWIFASEIDGTEVWIERFGGARSTDRHAGGQWSVYLPRER